MDDEPEQAPVEEQDSPEVEAPEQDSPQADETDWEQRYKDTQADFTRKSQELAEYEQLVSALRDPETQAQALEALGYELAEADEDDEYADPVDELRDRLAQLEQEREQGLQYAQQAQAQQEEHQYLDERFDALEEQAGRKFTQREIDLMVADARANPTADGKPDVDGAHKALETRDREVIEGYVKSKKGAPHALRGGTQATEQPDMSDDQQRQKWMTEQLRMAQES